MDMQPNGCVGGAASTRLSRSTLSLLTLSRSNPESFNPELTTERLMAERIVAVCGFLILKSIKRSVIHIRRSMFDVQSVHCLIQAI